MSQLCSCLMTRGRGSGGVYQIMIAKQCNIIPVCVCVMWIIMGVLQSETMDDCAQIAASRVKPSKQRRENLKSVCGGGGVGVTDI